MTSNSTSTVQCHGYSFPQLDGANPVLAVAVMGATGSGKSTFINVVSGSKLRIGKGLQSCTSAVQLAEPFDLSGYSVRLIDTPGFDDTTKSDSDILGMIAAFLATAYEKGTKLAGIIYIHRISDIRMSGISTRNFRMFRQLCGDATLRNVVIVTNMWGEVATEVGEAREAELVAQDMFFKPVLAKGALLRRHYNTRESAQNILSNILKNHPLPLQIQRELVDQKKHISQTAASEELDRELALQLQKYEHDMQAIREETQEAIRIKDEEGKRELEIESKKLQGCINQIQSDAQSMASKYSQEKNQLEDQMQKMADSARREAERAEAEYKRQMQELEGRLNTATSASASERQALDHEIRMLNDRLNEERNRGGCIVQ